MSRAASAGVRTVRRVPSLPAWSLLATAVALLPAVAAAQDATDLAHSTFSGDWNGTRSDWLQRGVNVRGDYVGEAMGVVDGGRGERGARYAQQVRLGVDLDLAKLAGWDGGALHVTVNDRRGRSTSADLLGNRFPIQEAYGGQFTRLTELSYDRRFNDGRTYVKAGFYAMGNQFGAHTLLTNFVNAAFCAHPLAMSGNSGWYNYPNARWGAEAAQQLTPAANLRVGWFQVNPSTNNNVHTAFDLDARGTTGSLFPVELTWTPGAGGAYPGTYKVGGYYDSSRVPRKGLDSRATTGRDGAYLLVEQKLYSPGGERGRGLTGFAQYMISDRATAQITRWYALGGVYQGIGRRSQDRIALGYVGADINHRLLDARRAALLDAGVPPDAPVFALDTAEELYELSYSAQLTPWLMLRPDVQYIVNPGTFAYARIDNALAVGLQVKLTF